MLSAQLWLTALSLVLLSQSIQSAPSNSSQVSKSSQHGNLHQNEDGDTKTLTTPTRFQQEDTDLGSSAGSLGEHQENSKAHFADVVVRPSPGGSPLSPHSSSASTQSVSTIWSRKSLSGTTPAGTKSHSQTNTDNVATQEDEPDPNDSQESSENSDPPNKSDTSSESSKTKDKLAAGDVIEQRQEDHSSHKIEKNKSPFAYLHRIPLNRSELLPSNFLQPPKASSQQTTSNETDTSSQLHTLNGATASDSDSKESREKEHATTGCTPFSTSTACFSKNAPAHKREEIDVVLIPGAPFRPPTILIIDTIITEPNSSESGSNSDENSSTTDDGSTPTTDTDNTTPTTDPTTTMDSGSSESPENVSQEIVEPLDSVHDALNGTIRHDGRVNDTKRSPERNEMESGLHLRPWFINRERTETNVSSGPSSTTTRAHGGNSATTSVPVHEDDHSAKTSTTTTVNPKYRKVSPISPAGHPSDLSSPPDSDGGDISPDNENEAEEKPKPQHSSPILSISPASLNRRRRDTIFSHLPNNPIRSQSVTHPAENNSGVTLSTSQETNNGSNSDDSTASIETGEVGSSTGSNGNKTGGKDTIHIFLEILHLQPISLDDGKNETGNSSSHVSPGTADNFPSDGSLDSTSNQNSAGSNSHKISHRPLPTVSSHGPSTDTATTAASATAGKGNPSPSPATSNTDSPLSTPATATTTTT